MNELAKKVYEVNKQRYKDAPNPLKSHGPDHHLRVYQYAQELADKLDVEYDEEVLGAACLLHDMAAYYPEKTREEYHDYDHVLAKEVLQEVNFPQNKMSQVMYAIANHGSDPKYKRDNEPIETTLLRDADKLDVFGEIGVARIIMVRTLKGDTLDEIVEDFYMEGHLQRKWEAITTNEAREIVREDYEYAKQFLARLSEKLGN